MRDLLQGPGILIVFQSYGLIGELYLYNNINRRTVSNVFKRTVHK